MIATAFILGFAGSFHCLGMCSPLAMTVTSASEKVMWRRIVYNAGRIFTYGVLGALIASAGFVFPLFRFQNLLSILLGTTLLVIGVTGVSSIRIGFITRFLGTFSQYLKSLFSVFLKKKTTASLFLMGSLNGFLPCGLSFIALTYCLTLAGPLDGFNFMLLFGAGTVPAMVGFAGVIQWLTRSFAISVPRITTAMLILSGSLLIARVFIFHFPTAGSVSDGMIDIVLCK